MRKTILVVEDFEDSRAMMRVLLEGEGHNVIEAAGAYEAIDKAEQFHPDLILMDIGLPLLDGLSTASIIKKIDGLALVPIVAVTAFRDVSEQARKAGCSGVIYKPVEIDTLKNALEFHLKGH
ncbi:MAG: response regulator [Chloracidobacterium sp.]|nr:response regulator [Chloracidobacterium sp.]